MRDRSPAGLRGAALLLLYLCACDDGQGDPVDAAADMQADGTVADARPDAVPDARVDAAPDAGPDARPDLSAVPDADPDGRLPVDAAPDGPPEPDMAPVADAAPDGGPDGGAPWIGEGVCDPETVGRLDPIDRVEGSTDGAPAGAEPSCSMGGGASERVFTWVAAADGLACLSLADADFDTVLYVREADCGSPMAEVECSDDAGGLGLGVQSAVTVDVRAGVRYFAFVDGYAGGEAPESGAFVLEIGRGPCRDGGRLRCNDDAECPNGRVCDGATCVACIDNDDCPDGFRCAEQRCEPGPMMGVGACAPDRLVAFDGFDVIERENRGAPVDDLGSCNPGTIGPEVAHVFTAPVDGPVCARTLGSEAELDTVVYVRDTCADPDSERVCHDDVEDGVITSAADFDAVAGEPVYVFVDTYTLDDVGRYVLALVPGPCADAPVCGADDPCPGEAECRINGCLPP